MKRPLLISLNVDFYEKFVQKGDERLLARSLLEINMCVPAMMEATSASANAASMMMMRA